MTFIVTDACVKCKYTTCVEVCPVDCFYEGKLMVAINPEECIDCGVCVPECPVDAIKEGVGNFDRKIKGYGREDAILTGIETRTSAPVKITRNERLEYTSVIEYLEYRQDLIPGYKVATSSYGELEECPVLPSYPFYDCGTWVKAATRTIHELFFGKNRQRFWTKQKSAR